ncbi:MAG: Holliday junction branch migration protein RuvA [Candidatus Babeliales bacterium]
MISLLEGTVQTVYDSAITLMCHGIGFELHVPNATNYAHHEKITVHTYVHWNQEQGFTLFGFRSLEEKKIFLLLISCQGVGPKLALAIFNELTINQLIDALVNRKNSVLSSVSGIGAKKAELITLHLHEKVAQLVATGQLHATEETSHLQQLTQVLSSLNYSRQEIASVIDQLRSSINTQESFDQLLRKALSLLSKTRVSGN